MAKKQQKPTVTYHQSSKDDAAVDAVFNMLFEKVSAQKAAEDQTTKTTRSRKSLSNSTKKRDTAL